MSDVPNSTKADLVKRLRYIASTDDAVFGEISNDLNAAADFIERQCGQREEDLRISPRIARAIKDAAADISSFMPTDASGEKMLHGTGTYEKWVEGAIYRALERHDATGESNK